MDISAMIVDWQKLQQAYNSDPEGFSLYEHVDEETGEGEWIKPAKATERNDSFGFNEEAGQLFDAMKADLKPEPRAILQEFFVYCCPAQWVDDDRLPPQDLTGEELEEIATTIEPARVKRCLERMQQVNLEEVAGLARRHVPVPGGRAMTSERPFLEFIGMWMGVFREAAAKGWGVLVVIG